MGSSCFHIWFLSLTSLYFTKTGIDCRYSFSILAVVKASLLTKAHADDNDKAGDDENDDDAPEPRNKKDLYKLFGQKGPTVMISKFMKSDALRQTARIIVDISFPLENWYYWTLERLSEGWHAQCAWASDRAAGSYVDVVLRTLMVLQSPALHDHLRLTPPVHADAVPEAAAPWMVHELKILDKAMAFASNLAEHILWSNLQYWLSIPQIIAGLLHKDRATRARIMEHAEKLVTALLKAENKVSPSGQLKELLQDLAWHKQQLPRETMALLLQHGFSDQNTEVVKLAKRLYTGSPSTKDFLENSFAWLHRKCSVNGFAQKMADATKFAYCITSPYIES